MKTALFVPSNNTTLLSSAVLQRSEGFHTKFFSAKLLVNDQKFKLLPNESVIIQCGDSCTYDCKQKPCPYVHVCVVARNLDPHNCLIVKKGWLLKQLLNRSLIQSDFILK